MDSEFNLLNVELFLNFILGNSVSPFELSELILYSEFEIGLFNLLNVDVILSMDSEFNLLNVELVLNLILASLRRALSLSPRPLTLVVVVVPCPCVRFVGGRSRRNQSSSNCSLGWWSSSVVILCRASRGVLTSQSEF
nr:uncharacterized protein LOC112736496 isoform X3 [Arachis hypogaea]